MQSLVLFLMMIFVYPVIFFSSLHLFKANYDLKFTLFQIWSRWFIKRASAKVECERCDLIPLENDYIFIVTHESRWDACVLAEALPVRTHFILDESEKIPYLNGYLKRLKTLRISYKKNDFSNYIQNMENDLNESSLSLFLNSINGLDIPMSFYEQAKLGKWTLIPVLIKNSKNLLKKGRRHHVKVEIKVPLYFEEYGKSESDDIKKLILERLQEK